MAAVAASSASPKSFGAMPVLDGIDLDIADGEFLTLVGPSGCGKSTLIRIIAGLEPQDRGSVSIGGAPVDHLRPHERRVAMVFQSYALYPHMTVFDNIALPLVMSRLNLLERLPLLRHLSPRRRRVMRGDRARGATRSRSSCRSRRCSTAGRRSSRAASASAWRSAAPWCAIRTSS